MTNHAEAIKRYRDEYTAATRHTDPDLSNEGLMRVKQQRADAARAQLLAARPELPQPAPSRDDVLAALLPRTADEIAVAQHEQATVRALLDAGQKLDEIIKSATHERALAVADLVETLPAVLASQSSAEIIAETRGAVFDRLAGGVESVASVVTIEQQNAPANAWHRAMTEVAESIDANASVGAWSDVHRIDPAGYELAYSGGDKRAAQQLRRVDGTPVTV